MAADDRDELSLEELEEAAGGIEGSNTNCATSCGNTNCVAGCTGGAATKDPAAG